MKTNNLAYILNQHHWKNIRLDGAEIKCITLDGDILSLHTSAVDDLNVDDSQVVWRANYD
jgi:hypothetical protein